eukprot:s90_g31.t1
MAGLDAPGVGQDGVRGRYQRWPGAAAARSRGRRQLFPLPLFACPPRKFGVSRTVAKRRNRICRVVENSNTAIRALNWLAGCRTDDSNQCSGMQQMVLARVDGLVFGQKPSGVVPSPQEALKALLRGSGPYDWSSPNETLASYRSELVSMPADITGCPFLADVVGESDRLFLKEKSELMMRREEDVSVDLVVPYWDPILKYNRKEYNALVQRLTSIGYFNFTTVPLCHVGVFFVWKSSRTRLRMITDARLANLKFKDAPSVSLMTSEGLGRIEVQLEGDLWQDETLADLMSVHVGLSDVENCFHRLRVPNWLSRYFCWSPVPAKVVGLSGRELEGKVLKPLDPVYPCAGSLCQGFSWALYFAQKANEQMCLNVSPLQDARLSYDRGPPIVLHLGRVVDAVLHYYVYVDNLGVIHFNKKTVEKALEQLVHVFDSRGLILHGSEVSSGEVKALGCLLEGDKMRTRLTSDRLWKVHQGISGLVLRKRCTGAALEKILGHCTFCGLINRMSLACFHAVYKFVQRFYKEPAFLWQSVVEELRAFQGCLFLTVQEWDRQWHCLVGSSDSSLSGYGVCHSWWPRDQVAKAGRTLERSRFRRQDAHSARESALSAAGLVNVDGKWCAGGRKDLEQLHEAGWETVQDFPEIPSSGLRRELWVPKMWGRWFHKEGILLLEARTLLKGLKRIAFTRWGHSLRQLLLCDNMSVVLAVERFRAKNFKLLVVIREIAAVCFARNIHLAIRWIPSELNISDEPSRKRDLVLPVETQASSKEVTSKKSRTLETDQFVQNRLMEKRVSNLRLPETSAELQALDTTFRIRCRDLQPDFGGVNSSDSNSTSSEMQVVRKGGKKRFLENRSKGSLKTMVDKLFQDPSRKSPLELAAVSDRVRQNYARRLKEFKTFLDVERLPTRSDEEMDAALVLFFNRRFQEGEGSSTGDYTLAALMDHDPSYGRLGSRHIPRAWRCIKGWRKLCPVRSRLAFPLPVWAAISWRMVKRGHLQKAIFNLIQLSTYSRPGALLKLRKLGLARPSMGITKHWAVITSLTETSDVGKTGAKDESVLLDSTWLNFLHPLLEELKRGNKMDLVWNFNYAEYLSVFRSCCQDLGIDVVPYQARHSGPSMDRASGARTQEEVRKRGGWVTRQSVARYEKAGRLAATWQKLDSAIQITCKAAETHLEAIILGHPYPEIGLP